MELTANNVQTVQANRDVLYTDVAVGGCRDMIHRNGSGIVTLRGITREKYVKYAVNFGANVAIPIGENVLPINLAIAIDGEPLSSTTMIASPTVVNTYTNINGTAEIVVPQCCCSKISVKNIGLTGSVLVQNANLIIERVE